MSKSPSPAPDVPELSPVRRQIDRLNELERRYTGPVPPGALLTARAGGCRARAELRAAVSRRELARRAAGLRLAIARRRVRALRLSCDPRRIPGLAQLVRCLFKTRQQAFCPE